MKLRLFDPIVRACNDVGEVFQRILDKPAFSKNGLSFDELEEKFHRGETLQYYDLESWGQVRGYLLRTDRIVSDDFLEENDEKVVGRFVGAFKDRDEAIFVVREPPMVEHKYLRYELVTLKKCEEGEYSSYYKVPRAKDMKSGVIFFPHEVMVIKDEDIMFLNEEGSIEIVDGRKVLNI